MKKMFLFITILIFAACRNSEPDIVLDQDFQISIDAEAMDPTVFAIVISNSLGGVLLEKTVEPGEINKEVVVATKVDKEHKIVVTIFRNFLNGFRANSYLDVKSGAHFGREELLNSGLKNVTVLDVDDIYDISFGAGTLGTNDLVGRDFIADVFYPDDTEFVVFAQHRVLRSAKYLKIENPSDSLTVSFSDFKNMDFKTEIFINDVNFPSSGSEPFYRERSTLFGLPENGDKKIPGFIGLTSPNRFEVFEIPDKMPPQKRMEVNYFNQTFQRELEIYPDELITVCPKFFLEENSEEAFTDSYFLSDAQYFTHLKFFSSLNSPTGNIWILEGKYEPAYSVQLPELSFEFKRAFPIIEERRRNELSSRAIYHFELADNELYRQFPVISPEWFFERGATICR